MPGNDCENQRNQQTAGKESANADRFMNTDDGLLNRKSVDINAVWVIPNSIITVKKAQIIGKPENKIGQEDRVDDF